MNRADAGGLNPIWNRGTLVRTSLYLRECLDRRNYANIVSIEDKYSMHVQTHYEIYRMLLYIVHEV